MTAFFLDFNHAAPLWWGLFITFVLIDGYIALVKYL